MPKIKKKATLTKTVWKVVLNKSGELLSISIPNPISGLTLSYSTKRFIRPKLKGSQIFCFDCEAAARIFAQYYSLSEIWEAEAEGVKRLKHFGYGGLISLKEGKSVWLKGGGNPVSWAPSGTKGCDAIKLIKKVR